MTSRLPLISFQRDASGRAIAVETYLGANVHLGNNVTIYPKVHIGEKSIVMDGAVLGRVPISNRTTTRVVNSSFSDLIIGSESIIGCNSVLYTGSRLGNNILIGDLASIREGCTIGDGVIIGRGTMLLYECEIGNYCRIQDQVYVASKTVVEDHVFIGMGVTTARDNEVYLSRFDLVSPTLKGLVIHKFAVIGSGATIIPGVEVGTGAMVAAGAVVTKNVPAWTVVAGVPARHVRDIPDNWRQQIEALHGD